MLNPMSGTYIYGARASGDVASQEARVRDELRQTEAGLGDARKALDAANHDLEDAQLGRMPSPQSSGGPKSPLADILIVEDGSLRAMLRKTLDARGYAVDEAADAYEARRRLAASATSSSSPT